ncbi:TPA: fructose PTS transporter subunit IIA [Streptococcus pneumoniae]
MEIKDILNVSLIQTDLQMQSKEEVFEALAQLLVETGYVSDRDQFIEGLYQREAEGQTGIGNYIAIPHSKSSAVEKAGVVIAINHNEIPWETIDGKGVKVIVLFAVGDDTEAAREHLKTLSLFARKLGNDEVVAKLVRAQTSDDVIAVFC